MNKLFLSIVMAVFLLNAAGIPVPQWHSIGLAGDTVCCLAVDADNRVFAGSEAGLFVYYNKQWQAIKTDLPVKDVLVIKSGRIVFAGGNQTQSDGLYQADMTINIPPSYSVKKIDYLKLPQTLGKTPSGDFVYVGNATGVSASKLDSSTFVYMPLQPLKVPPYCFGVEGPVCGGLQVYSSESVLFAGGYDSSPVGSTVKLLRSQGDSLAPVMNLNVTTMVEGAIEWSGPKVFFGTRDSGIYMHTIANSFPPRKFCDAPIAGPIRDIVISVLDGGGLLFAAATNDVYQYRTTGWIALGAIPVQPLSLAVYKADAWIGFGPPVLAGTYNGVYEYSTAPADIHHALTNSEAVKNRIRLQQEKGSFSVSFTLARPSTASVMLLDATGRTVATLLQGSCNAGNTRVSWKSGRTSGGVIGNGMYIVAVTTGEFNSYRRVCIAE
jgi:hypothetical protein